jgi:uncharacterized protein (DUF1499 family)
MNWILAVMAVPALGYFLVLVVLGFWSRRPPELGLVDGHLRRCRSASNCVNTEDTADRRAEAPFGFTGSPEAALDRLGRAIVSMPGARLCERAPAYLRAEFRSSFFGFVDDVEATVDPAAGVLHLRSASRVGRGDHGINRARVKELRRRYAAAQSSNQSSN